VKVVLRADVEDLGTKGDIVEVSDGYARNYLVARGLGLPASAGAVQQAESMKRAAAKRNQRERESADRAAELLQAKAIKVLARAGADGRLFGSVTSAAIAEAVQAQTGVELDRRRLELGEPIRTLGVHTVDVRLHRDVEATLTLEVVLQ
jgi:large subunit ribosomal protein L9